ncbi:MAG: hypothetical protein B6I28_04530 [Fusobacteriia bacterium 4572_132]|nr:MAG: hypothetical protein B6I28_04530 [Fusobacteriia bacterium 4572_132]
MKKDVKKLLIFSLILLIATTVQARKIFKNFDEYGKIIMKNADRIDNFKKIKKIDMKKIKLNKTDEIINTIKKNMPDIDNYTIKPIKNMPKNELIELLEKSKKINYVNSNFKNSNKLLTNLGENGIYQAMTYGDEVIEGVNFFGKNYKKVVKNYGSSSIEFYKKYVKGNEKWWISGTLASMYLANPEKFHDASGKATEWFAQQVADGVIKTTVVVSENIAKGVLKSLDQNFKYISNSPYAIMGFIGFIILFLAPLRNLVFRSGKYLIKIFVIGDTKNKEKKSNKKKETETETQNNSNEDKRFNDFN